VKRERLSETSPAFRILSVEPRYGRIHGRSRAAHQHGADWRKLPTLPVFFPHPEPPLPSLSCTPCGL
jgi:hypothetical protein